MSKRIRITIEIDGPAFRSGDVAQRVEICTVLSGIEQNVFNYGLGEALTRPVLDSQGNRVGTVEMMEDDG